MSYSTKVKKALSQTTAVEIGLETGEEKRINKCCTLSFFYGAMLFSNKLDKSTMTISLENEKLLEILTYIMIHHFLAKPTVRQIQKGGKTKFEVSFKRELLAKELSEMFETPSNEFECKNCLKFFLRGVFLASGNITDPERDYRAEFIVKSEALAKTLTEYIKPYTDAKVTKRGSAYVVYIKGSERIETFCALIGAKKVAFDVIEKSIEKDKKNALNRQCNCDSANIKKTVSASVDVRLAIKKLRDSGKFSSLPDELKKTAELREKYPEESLSSLALLYEGGISRSGLNHRMKKLIELSKK